MNIEKQCQKTYLFFKNTVLFEQKRLRKISLTDFILRNNELRREPRMKGGGDGGKGRGTTGKIDRGRAHLS